MTETDPRIKCIWDEHLDMEIAHLHKACELLKKYEGKEWNQVIPCGDFPKPLALHENIEYVRNVLCNTVQYTGVREDYDKIENLPDNADFFTYQHLMIPSVDIVQSHCTIETRIKRRGSDYRYEVAPNPIPPLRARQCDNTCVGRAKNAAQSTDFCCN